MTTRSSMSAIWSSLLSDGRLQEQLKIMSNLNDPEEQAIQVVCRTLFLLVMDIKQERDEAIKKFSRTNESSLVCQNCKMKVAKDELNIGRIDEEIASKEMDDGVGQTGENDSKMRKRSKNENVQTVEHKDGWSVSDVLPNRASMKAQKKGDKSYRCLSKTSPREVDDKIVSDVTSKDKLLAGVTSKEKLLAGVSSKDKLLADVTSKENIAEILVPETLSLDEHELHVNLEKRKTFATQTVVVPETLAVDMYGNTDFFESEAVSIRKDNPHVISKESGDFRSPLKGQNISFDSDSQQSPVLGKQGNTTPKALKKQEKLSMAKCLKFESPPKEPLLPININSPLDGKTLQTEFSLQVSTEDLNSGNVIPQDASTPRYSPLEFTCSLSPALSDVSFTSPSLLNNINAKIKNATDKSPPRFEMPHKEGNLRVVQPEVKKKTFKKSISSFDTGGAKENVRVLRRHQTEDKPNNGRLYELSVGSPDPSTRKKYKQARISEMPLVPKTDVTKSTGGAPKMTYDAAVNAALEASLKTKEMEDMMRKKRQELRSRLSSKTSADGVKDVQIAETLSKGKKQERDKSEFRSPTKAAYRTKDSDLSSPFKKPFKKPSKSPRKSPVKRPRQSPVKLSPLKIRQNKKDADKGEEIVDLDELLNQVNDSSLQDAGGKKPEVTSPEKKCAETSGENGRQKESARMNAQSKVLNQGGSQSVKDKSPMKAAKMKKRKLPLHEDSFDVIPALKDDSLGYAYQGDVVRNKAARRQLEGWECHECRKWYEGADLDPAQRKVIMNRCSRHRSKHNPVTNTPKGFWDPDWVDDSDDSS